MRNSARALALATAGSSLFISSAFAGTVPYTVHQIAHEGHDSGQGGAFATFSQPVINSAGLLAFEAEFSSGGFLNDSGVFTHNLAGAGTPTLVARNGMPAPGTATNFSSFFLPHLNNAGQTAIHVQLSAPGEERSAIYGGSAGSLSLLAREGSPAPGPAGTVWRPQLTGSPFPSYDQATNDSGLRLNQAGQVAFFGQTRRDTPDGPVFSGGLFLASPGGSTGSVQPIVAGTQPLPSVGGNISMGAGTHPYLLNDNGNVLFRGVVTDSPSNDGYGYFIGNSSGDITPVVMTGQPSPIAGLSYQSHPRVAMGFNNSGMVAFQMGVQGPGVQIDVNDNAVFAGTPGDLRAVYQENDLIPGAGNGARFAYDAIGLTMNQHGQIAFASWARDGVGAPANDQYLMFGTPDAGGEYDLSIVASAGIDAGLDGDIYRFGEFQEPTLNGNGLYFTALTYGDTNNDLRKGIWGYTPDTGLFTILAEGQQVEVEPGVFMTIAAFSLVTGSGGEDGRRTGINDNGELAVYLRFPGTGGSTYDHGIYVLTVPALAVPEPGSMAAIALLGIPALLRRRRRELI